MKKFFIFVAILAVFLFQAIPAIPADLPKTIVSISLDDGQASLFSQAYKTLKKYGIPATAYLIPSRIGSTGYVSRIQLGEMVSSGIIEPGNHTWDHSSFLELTDDQILAEIRNVQNYFLENGFFNKGAFTPPFGEPYDDLVQRDRMKKLLKQTEFISSSRVPWDDSYILNTMEKFDHMALNSYQLANPRKYADAKKVIDQAVAEKAFLIFTAHDVNSGSVAGDFNSVEFEKVVQYLASLKAQGKIEVMNISDGTAKMIYYKTLP
jgi:peptidoglycan/xylan/chitin deacetylase (PgdA/CDA1 family)